MLGKGVPKIVLENEISYFVTELVDLEHQLSKLPLDYASDGS